MRAEQRKTVFVLLELLRLGFPALYRVALRAIRAKLAPMNVSVAIRTSRAGVLENQIRVALLAVHFRVQTAQGVAGPVVIELGNAANRFPTGVRMAVFAGNADRAVRVAGELLTRLGGSLPRNREDNQPKEQLNGPCPIHEMHPPSGLLLVRLGSTSGFQ